MKKKTGPSIKMENPIDLRYKYVKGIFCKRKRVETSLREQRRLKKSFMKIYPDNMFIDDLNDKNSVILKDRHTFNDGDSNYEIDYEYCCGDDCECSDNGGDCDCDCGCDCSGDD